MSDRRTAREAIMDAFRDIILEGGYESVRVLDVVARSGVARSTFYEHFQSREDLLRDSLRGVFEHLAHLAEPSCNVARVVPTLEHLYDNRMLVKSLMANPGIEVLVDVFSGVIEADAAAAPIPARAVAGAHLAVLSTWLERKDALDTTSLAKMLRRMTIALLQVGLDGKHKAAGR